VVLLLLNSVIVSWLTILAVSSLIGLLLANTIGSRVGLRTLLALSVVNFVGITAVIIIFIMPMRSEAQVYAYAEFGAVLIIVLLCLLPSTLFFWLVRLMKKR